MYFNGALCLQYDLYEHGDIALFFVINPYLRCPTPTKKGEK